MKDRVSRPPRPDRPDPCDVHMKPGWTCTRGYHMTGPCALVQEPEDPDEVGMTAEEIKADEDEILKLAEIIRTKRRIENELSIRSNGGAMLRDVHVCPWPSVSGQGGAQITNEPLWRCDCGHVWVLRQTYKTGLIGGSYTHRWSRVYFGDREWVITQWLRIVHIFR